jgi:hypothetical protein
MWQALAGYLGSNTTAFPQEKGEANFIAETKDPINKDSRAN